MNLDALKAAVKPLTKFGQDELTFTVPTDDGNEVSVTLRPLLPAEEIKCQRYAQELLNEAVAEEGLEGSDTLSRTTALHYMDNFRTEIISYALVMIGGTDLRGVRHVETGETTESGVPVKIPKEKALRQIIAHPTEGWSRGMITIVFSKYGDLITKISDKADKVARESLSDLDAEIERVERRLATLREERESRAQGDPSVTAKQIQSLVRAGEAMEAEVDQAIQQSRADREASEAIRQAAHVTDEEIADEPDPVVEPEPVRPPRQSVIPPTAPPPVPPPNPAEFRSSFEDFESPDSQAIENERLLAAQRAAAEGSRQALSQEDALGAVSRAEEAGYMRGPDGQVLRDSQGQPIPAFRLPSETISARGRKGGDPVQPGKKTILNPDPSGASRNPNFKPPGGS